MLDPISTIPLETLICIVQRLDLMDVIAYCQNNNYTWNMRVKLAEAWFKYHVRHCQYIMFKTDNLDWYRKLIFHSMISDFDTEHGAANGFRFHNYHLLGNVAYLTNDGPKLLLSKYSTQDVPILMLRFFVRGNTAIEFGLVKNEESEYNNVNVLHQGVSQYGVSSHITVGSLLPMHITICKGALVTLAYKRGEFRYSIRHFVNSEQLIWQGNRTVPRPYTGPPEMNGRMVVRDTNIHYRLAVSCWRQTVLQMIDVKYPPLI